MKFNCRHRTSSGSVECDVLDVFNRSEAFNIARANGWTVVEMTPLSSKHEHTVKYTPTNDEKNYPSSQELEFLKMRRNAFWIGFWCSWIALIGWIIGAAATFIKYDMRGLKCSVYGLFACAIPAFFTGATAKLLRLSLECVTTCNGALEIVTLISAIVIFVLGWWLPFYIYKKRVLMGFTVKSWGDEL